jgi:hypothetical protein
MGDLRDEGKSQVFWKIFLQKSVSIYGIIGNIGIVVL